jgi:2-keto-4-pentenoate hydratase/2-oxohepta-3-ene-1,7-dioic acid hydratase in catechol pathway
MKLATVATSGIPRVVGSLDEVTLFDLERLSAAYGLGPSGFPRSMVDLLGSGRTRDRFLQDCADVIETESGAQAYAYRASEVEWRAPVEQPSKIVCVNSNRPTSIVEQYEPEYGGGWPRPIFFLKAPSSVIGHGATIQVFSEMNSKVQLEGEPAVVIGKRATKVKAEDALDYVAGLSLVGDISASLFGLQDAVVMMIPGKDGVRERFINRAMARSKGVDTFCPFGPWITPLADIGDPRTVEMETHIVHADGTVDVVQKGTIGQQNFSIEQIIETVTANMTLEVGDVIAMGAMNMVEGYYLRRGDLSNEPDGRVELIAPALGHLSNPISVASLADRDMS